MPKELKSEMQQAVGQARNILEDLRRLGVGEVFCQPAESCDAPGKPAVLHQEANLSLPDVEADLGDCRRCRLAEHRSRIVFGSGHPNAELVFVGEGPGREEDQAGEPFIGEAGQLLDRIISAMGMQRSDVYICNIVKCRPPDNRDPHPDEIAACEPFLLRQLDAIKPQIIVALGKFAAQTLLQSETPITRLRGQWHLYHQVPVMPTFHPAYLLRNPLAKRDVWSDMKAVLKKLRDNHSSGC